MPTKSKPAKNVERANRALQRFFDAVDRVTDACDEQGVPIRKLTITINRRNRRQRRIQIQYWE